MKQARTSWVVVLLACVLLAACGGAPAGAVSSAPDHACAPGSADAGSADGGGADAAPEASPRPRQRVPLYASLRSAAFRAATRPPMKGQGAQVGFALHKSGDLVAFDPRTGAELGRFVFGRELTDVCWDARTRRVLIVEHDYYDDGSRVHAVRWTGSDFVLESSSPVLPGHSRIWAAADRVYAVSEDQGVVWNVLDDDLAPVGQFQPLVPPVSMVELAVGGHSRLLALDTSARLAEQPADQLLGVSHPGNDWHITHQSYLAPGRPSARMVAGPPGTAYLLHKDAADGTIELARISTTAPVVPPDFHVVMTGAGAGALEGAAYDPARRLVVVAISRVPAARLALVPTETGRPTALVTLDSAIRDTAWWSRDLVREAASGRIFVATEQGVVALLPRSGAPALVPDSAFSAPDLRDPVVLVP